MEQVFKNTNRNIHVVRADETAYFLAQPPISSDADIMYLMLKKKAQETP